MKKAFKTFGNISIGLTCISLDSQKERREVQNKYVENGQNIPKRQKLKIQEIQ